MTSPDTAKALDEALEVLLASDEPVQVRLRAYAETLRELNRPFAEAVDRLILRLAAVDAGASAPGLGDVLPGFWLPDQTGRLTALDQLLTRGPLVVAFRRGHWCPYCLIATDALARIETEVEAREGSLVVITPDREGFTRKMKQRLGASFPLLTDMDNAYALSIGLAISVGEEMRDFMSRRGRSLDDYHGNSAWMLPIPATFVLDRTGVIVMRHVDKDYRCRAATVDILAALDRLRNR